MRNCPQLTECPIYKSKVPLSTSSTKKPVDKGIKGNWSANLIHRECDRSLTRRLPIGYQHLGWVLVWIRASFCFRRVAVTVQDTQDTPGSFRKVCRPCSDVDKHSFFQYGDDDPCICVIRLNVRTLPVLICRPRGTNSSMRGKGHLPTNSMTFVTRGLVYTSML